MTITFEKAKTAKTMYRTYSDGVFVGYVKRCADWTVRGERVVWEAWYRGVCLATSAATRKEAASYLTVSR